MQPWALVMGRNVTKIIALGAGLALAAGLFAACAGVPGPASAPAPISRAAELTVAGASDPENTTAAAFETQSNGEGSVEVAVKPTALQVGQPMQFAVGMNTHSVNLSDDMTQAAIVRDDAGNEYEPIAWDGAAPGGHHRSGTLSFAALKTKPKYVELVVRGVAQVPERVFKWDLP